MEKLIVTEFGDTITPYNSHTFYIFENSVVFHHLICFGFVDLIIISDTHNALRCRKCNLRVCYPTELEDYKSIQKYFNTVIKGRK